MNNGKTVVTVLDDESKMRSALKRLLGTHGYEVLLFETGEDFINAALGQPMDCLLLDLHMPKASGFDVLRSMAALQIQVPAIIITGHDEPGNAERAYQLGAAGYLLKPLDETTLIRAIGQACLGVPPPA